MNERVRRAELKRENNYSFKKSGLSVCYVIIMCGTISLKGASQVRGWQGGDFARTLPCHRLDLNTGKGRCTSGQTRVWTVALYFTYLLYMQYQIYVTINLNSAFFHMIG